MQREPTGLVVAKGKKHLSNKEIEMREVREVKPNYTAELQVPRSLTKKADKELFKVLWEALGNIDVIGDTDAEVLAQFISIRRLLLDDIKELNEAKRGRDAFVKQALSQGYDLMEGDTFEIYSRHEALVTSREGRVIKLRNQFLSFAKSLCLTIDSRCRIQVPQVIVEEKVNKFARFEKVDKQA